MAVNNLCQDQEGSEANYIAGTPYLGANVRMYAGPGGYRGELVAWDPLKGESRWRIREKFPVWSGTLATAGGLVFYGTMDGAFKALDASNGHELWRFQSRSGIIGQPVTFRGPDGKQYMAILSGVGGWPGAVVTQDLDTRDSSAALGFVGAVSDLKDATRAGGELHVFSL